MTPNPRAELIVRYTDQPPILPESLRPLLHKRATGPVRAYALADLDPDLQIGETWVVVLDDRVAVCTTSSDEPRVETFARDAIKTVEVTHHLSCNVMRLLGPGGAVATLHYSNRQRRAFGIVQTAIETPDFEAEADADERYVEAVAHAVRETQNAVSKGGASVLWRLVAYLRPYRKTMAYGLGAAVGMTLFNLVPPFLAGRLIDDIVRPFQEGAMESSVALQSAWLLVGAIAAVYVLREVLGWVRLRTLSVMGEEVARDLRNDLYRHLQRLSMSYFSRKQTGSIVSRVTSDTDRIWDFIAFGIVEVSIAIILLTGLGSVLIALDWRLGLVVVVPVPFLLWVIARHGSRMQGLFTRIWRQWSSMTEVVSGTVPGMKVVKAFNQEHREVGRFRDRNEAVLVEANRIHRVWTSFWPLLMTAILGITVLVWVLALPRLLGAPGEVPLTAGTFVSFLLYLTMFVAPIEVIGQVARMLNRATSSAHRIFEILDTEPEVVAPENGRVLDPMRGEVAFNDVSFSYDGVRPVLKGVSLRVEAGTMVGLVGPSGGGKSTSIGLLARFYDVSGGSITVDGVDVRELDLGTYRRQVGIVLQDPYLFHGTIVDNIRYGHAEASLQQVVAAAKAANAHSFISKLPQGYDTVVGERGHTLSGGERQRVSIARAILHDPKLLILDEATSAVDTETERQIQEALDRLVQGRTVLAIAHRLSTLARADRLVVIEDGKVSEEGTHAELLAKPGGCYRKLHETQRRLSNSLGEVE